jgi:hypothetical protein
MQRQVRHRSPGTINRTMPSVNLETPRPMAGMRTVPELRGRTNHSAEPGPGPDPVVSAEIPILSGWLILPCACSGCWLGSGSDGRTARNHSATGQSMLTSRQVEQGGFPPLVQLLNSVSFCNILTWFFYAQLWVLLLPSSRRRLIFRKYFCKSIPVAFRIRF